MPGDPVGERGVARGAVGDSRRAGTRRSGRRARARPLERAARRACWRRRRRPDPLGAVERVEDRLEVGAGAGGEDGEAELRRSRRRRQLREAPAGRAQAPGGEQLVDAREHVVAAQVRERAVGRQPVVGVLLDTFERPPQRISTARVRPTAGSAASTTAKIASSSSPRPAVAARPAAARRARAVARRRARRRRGRRRHDRRIAHVAARHARIGERRRRVAEVAQQRSRRQRALLDERPDRAVLAPAHARRVAGRRAAGVQRGAVHAPTIRPTARSGGDGAGLTIPARARWPTIERAWSASPPLPVSAASSRKGGRGRGGGGRGEGGGGGGGEEGRGGGGEEGGWGGGGEGREGRGGGGREGGIVGLAARG